MKTPKHTLDEYRNISADVWNVFKKYFDDDADTDSYTYDVDALEKKYKSNPRLYEFYMNLTRVYFKELHELKELKCKNG